MSGNDRPTWLEPSESTSASGGTTWDDVMYAVKSMPQLWVNGTSDRLSRSSWTFSIGCATAGAVQDPTYTDIYTAVADWFSNSSTGATCTEGEAAALACGTSIEPDGCYYQAVYSVWNSGIMDCYAYKMLEHHVQRTCVDGGWGDCGCGVYYNYGSGLCLVGTYVYHASGPDVTNGHGPAEPEIPETTVNYRRDSKGPSYNDLTVCAYTGNGDVREWCEGATTHVC